MGEVEMTQMSTEQEIRQLELVAELEGHSDRAWSLAWNPTMPVLASCSSDKDVRLFQYSLPKRRSNDKDEVEEEEEEEKTLPRFFLKEVIPTGHSRTVRCIAWSPSGKTLATASFDSTVGIWERVADVMMAVKASGATKMDQDDAEEGQANADGAGGEGAEWDCVGTLEGHDSECKAIAFSHTGSVLASCSRDKSVWIWEVQAEAEFDCLSVLMEHSQDVKTVAWHPKEELLASASYDDTIKLYVDDPSEEWFAYTTLTGHTSTIWSLAFSPCGNYLASASEDKTVRIWQRLTPEQAEDRGLKVLGKIDGIRKGDRWICVRILKGWHTRSIYSVSWGDDVESLAGNTTSSTTTSLGRIATAGADGQICIFQVSTNSNSRKVLTQSESVDPTEPANDKDDAGSASESTLAPSIQLIARQYEAHGDSDINCVSWAPSKLRKATNLDQESVRFRELNEEEVQELEMEDQRKVDEDTFPLSNLLASAADDGTVKVWIL